MKNPWKTISRSTVYRGFLGHKVQIDKVIGPSGKESEYFIVELNNNSVILGLTKDNKVVAEKTWRYPINKEILELPVGGIEEGEDPMEAAKREFKEETGYTSNDWIFMGSHFENDGFCTARSNIFLARDVVAGKVENPDENEKIEVELIDFKKLKEMVLSNEIEEVRTKLAVMLAESFF
jgi:ADP-ribose pyrophosphatase